MQQGRSREQETAASRIATVQFRESPMREGWIGKQLFGQTIEPPTEYVQHAREVVLGRAACLEQQVDAGAQLLRRASVGLYQVIERGATSAVIGAVRIRPMIQEPFQHRR